MNRVVRRLLLCLVAPFATLAIVVAIFATAGVKAGLLTIAALLVLWCFVIVWVVRKGVGFGRRGLRALASNNSHNSSVPRYGQPSALPPVDLWELTRPVSTHPATLSDQRHDDI